VQYLATHIYESDSTSLLKKLFVKKDQESNRDILVIDLAVYSKNRYFRIYKSTKWGKNRPLEVSPLNSYIYKSEYQFFLDSLICNVPKSALKLTFQEQDFKKKKRKLSVTPTKSPICKKQTVPSPYSKVDQFVITVLDHRPGTPGYIAGSVYYPDSNRIIYNINKNKYCENIGREHKSNHIMIVVDIKNGYWYQKCHDIDCKDYRSPGLPLPLDLFSELSAQLKEKNPV